jgi:hypothetical protein
MLLFIVHPYSITKLVGGLPNHNFPFIFLFNYLFKFRTCKVLFTNEMSKS